MISVLFLADNCEVEICENEITKKAKQELKEYFAGERKEFSHFRMQLPGFEGESASGRKEDSLMEQPLITKS